MCDAGKLEKVKQAAKLCTECNGVACRKCPYDEHNNGGIGVPMCGVVFATDVLAVIDFMEQAMQAKDADLLATSDKLMQEIEQLRQRPDVVRCKDCRFHYDAVERASETYWMPCDDYVTNDNWFCGWGKRKDGDGDADGTAQIPG